MATQDDSALAPGRGNVTLDKRPSPHPDDLPIAPDVIAPVMPASSTPTSPSSGAGATTVALIVAAGRGSRFGGDLPKQYRTLAGEPVLRRTLRAFLSHPGISAVRPIIHPDDAELFRRATAGLSGLSLLDPIAGGAGRRDRPTADLPASPTIRRTWF